MNKSICIALWSVALSASLLVPGCTETDELGAPTIEVPAALDLGAGDCGGVASSTFELRNDGAAPLTFELSSVDARVALSPAGGTVLPGDALTVAVTADVPAEVRAGDAFTATVVARSNAGEPRSIALAFTARGAMLAVEPSSISIGEQPVGAIAAPGFTVRNHGNAAATVAMTAPGGDFAGSLSASTLAPGAVRTGEMTYLPRELGADVGAAAFVVTGAVCGARPDVLRLAGTGVAGDGLLVQGGPIDFGTVTCNGDDATRTLTIVNPTAVAGRFTAEMWDGDLDELNFEVSPRGGSVPAHGKVEITVRRRDAQGPGSPRTFESNLRITTTLGATTIHDVAIHEVLQTAELRLVGETDFGYVPANSSVSVPVTLVNQGTAAARVSLGGSPQLAAALPTWIAAGSSAVGWVTYTNTAPTPFEGKLTALAVGSCQRPIEVAYRAGHGAYTVLHPADVCDATAVTATKLWVSNPGDAPLQIRCAPSVPSPLALGFAQQTLTVPARGSAAFDVQMAVGDATPGTVVAEVECVANEGRNRISRYDTTVTRTIVAAGESCMLVID